MRYILIFLLLAVCLVFSRCSVLTTTSISETAVEPIEGYWQAGNSYYLEIDGDELIVRDSMKRQILRTSYLLEEDNGKLNIIPEDMFFSYPHLEDPYAEIIDFYLEDGSIYIHFSHNYMPDEVKEAVFDRTDEGPFDNIIIRDDEFLDSLQGKWVERPGNFYVINIEGNHMSIGFENEGKLEPDFETDFHVISYTYNPDRIFLINDDLVETEFYAFTQFEYKDDRLHTSEMVLDADWDTSVVFSRPDAQK